MSLFKGIAFAEPLAKLHQLCFNVPWNEDSFRKILSLPTTFGLGDEHGFILYSDLGEDFEILTLGIHPSMRKKGIASRLLKELQELAEKQQKKHIFLEVNSMNIPAINLYLKCGFIQSGKRPHYYHEQNQSFDALCFKWINPRI